MAYRYEKNPINGEYDLVIDGWEKGIASSPFKGIGNIRNLNIKYYEGVAYVNYKRQACTITGGTMANPLYACQSPAGIIYISDSNRQIWKQSAVNGSTFALLTGNSALFDITGIAFWNNYLLSLCDGLIEICGDGTGDAAVTSSNWNGGSTASTNFTVTIATPAVFTANNHGLVAGDNVRFTTSGALPTGLSTGTNYYVIAGGLTANTFEVSATVGGAAINTSGSQSGTHSFTVARGVWPIKNLVSLTLTAIPAGGATSATLSSYTDAGGVSRSVWNGPTGIYGLAFSGTNQIVSVSMVQGSDVLSWTPALNTASNSTTVFLFFNGNTSSTSGVQHPSLIAANDGNLYFCNGSNIASLKLALNQIFDKTNSDTYDFTYNVLALPPTETATWLMELTSQLIVAGKYRLYPWDFTSTFWNNPVPLDESMVKGINILNNLYIFAGNKGNIYISNGYSISRYAKLPDYIAGVVDPSWNIGGIMQHRQRLCFQATAKNGQTNAVILQGTFSLDLDTAALNMEAQNSGGLAPTGLIATGVLIDDNSLSINYDKYYSAYGATTNSIDFNDTTLWSGSEPLIETDIIPVGTFFQSKTFRSAEFKLDQPLQSGDSISLYFRPSLSDSYTLIGTTTTAVLSEGFPSVSIEKMQWAQFKVTMTCNATATSSSFNRLREIRIR